jgi:hypothetical protein
LEEARAAIKIEVKNAIPKEERDLVGSLKNIMYI